MFTPINTYVTKVLSLSLVPKRGSMEPPWKPLFHRNFAMKFTVNICTIKIHNSAHTQKNENVVPFQNGGQITDFYFASFRFWPKFPKEFLNEIWTWRTWIDLHYWNNILKKIYSISKWRPKQFLILCNNADLC